MKKSIFNKKILSLSVAILAIVILGMGILYHFGLTRIPFLSALPDHKQVKIACVGDSVTYGYGLPNWKENNYPAVLQDMLGEDFHVMNFGMSGYCVQLSSDKPYSSSERYEMSLNYDSDIVIFMLGSNDSKVDNWQGKEHFINAYLDLLNNYADSDIILCTPATAFYIDENGEVARNREDGITTFNIQPAIVEDIADIVRDIAKERGLPLIDINDLTENHPEWFAVDGTHPNEDGARAIAEEVYDKISELGY